MTLPPAPGTRLGPYELVSLLGEGGMGQVYRARDTKLDRDVAIKLLPAAFAQDADRVARFTREAKVLASLNHPNIAAIYGIEEAGDTTALVMELVEGEDLSALVASGPLSPSTALPIARQIAEALEAAHEQGVIHRDLKPANVKVRTDGTVKVLDFGLAKAVEPTSAAASTSVSMSPTITTPAMTQMGMILGTAAYMSPEQARGRPVDKRADIWAFGCVLYEMLTGRRLFEGEDVSLTLAAVLRAEVPLETLPDDTPARVRQVLAACLQRDPKQRARDIGDVRLLLDGAFDTGGPEPAVPASAPAPPFWRRVLPLAATATATLLVTAMAAWSLRPVPRPSPIVRSVHTLPEGRSFRSTGRMVVALAPDGHAVAYNAVGGLYLRPLDSIEDRVVTGTEGLVTNPVFSPDGQELAFFEDGQLKRIAANGGVSVAIGPATNPSGMSWEADGTILFAQADGIWRVPATGGTPERVIATEGDEQASSPQQLPGSDWVLYTLTREPTTNAARWDQADIVAVSLSSGERRVLRSGGSGARYLPTGHLVYAYENTLYAAPFDVDRVEVTGAPVPVVRGVRQGSAGVVQFSVAADGTLAYVPGASTARYEKVLGVMSRAGEFTRLGPMGRYDNPRISPDGRWAAFTATYSDGDDVAVFELGTDTAPRRLTFGGNGRFPIWSADGQRVIFGSEGADAPGLYWQVANGSAGAQRLTTANAGERHVPDSASPDGQHVAFTVYGGDDVAAVWMLTLAGQDAEPLITAPSSGVDQAVFSPDGRWLAYQSFSPTDNALEAEVFVQPFPLTGARYQLPIDKANHHPLWSPDGRELFYVPFQQEFAVVSVATQPGFTFGNPVTMGPTLGRLDQGNPSTRRRFDMMPDGSGFLTLAPAERVDATETDDARAVRLVLNWAEELKRLVPPN